MYKAMRTTLGFSLERFFDRINVKGTPVEEGPLVIIALHPFSVMDPFVVAQPYKREIDFVAKATMFENPVKAWFLRKFRMHPIHRVQDGAGLAEMKENLRKLSELAGHVAGGGAVMIFIEGQSNRTRRTIDKLMDGPAKVILDAQNLLDAEGKGRNVQVQIVGQTYGDFEEPFNSSVTINLMPPFSAAEFAYGVNAKKPMMKAAYDKVTTACEQLLRDSIAEVAGSEAELVERVQKFYHSEQSDDDRARIRKVQQEVSRLLPTHVNEVEELQERLDEYLALAQKLKVHPGEERRPSCSALAAWLAWPFAWIGWALHWPPYLLTRLRVNRRNTHPAMMGYSKLIAGMQHFTGWYLLLTICLMAVLLGSSLSLWAVLGFGAGALLAAAALGVCAGRMVRRVNARIWRLLHRPAYKRYCALGAELHQQMERYRQAGTDK